jgi:4-hydroxy-3-polyprenylbenzoate decarboxylase
MRPIDCRCAKEKMSQARNRMIVAVSGPGGVAYSLAILDMLRSCAIETHLVISRDGQASVQSETGLSLPEFQARASVVHRVTDIAAAVSSGSFPTLGMIVVPCTTSALAEIANGVTTTLLTRAADVVLKERRRLLLVTCEAPLHLGHLHNMTAVSRMGAIIYPAASIANVDGKEIDRLLLPTVRHILGLFQIGDLAIPAR